MRALASCIITLGLSGTAFAQVMVDDDDKTMEIDCSTTKTILVSGNTNTFNLTGVCDKVMISGNHNTVTGSVKGADVSGNENTFTLEAVDVIRVSGNKNKIVYKKPATKKKTGVLNSGNGNKIAKVK